MKYGIMDYEVIGDGTPVLIIHGWGISRLTMKGAFEPIFEEVSGYRRYYIDLPGMGASEHGNVRNSDDILELLHEFAADVIREPFMIIGQSYGGLLARGFVNKFPEMLSKIILLVPCIIPGEKQGRVEPLTVMEKDDALLNFLSKEERDSFMLMNVVLTKEVWERYEKYLMPCLIIAAKQDTEVGYKDQFDLMEKYTNATYIAVEKAGHNLQIEQPEIFESVVKSWMRRYAMC